MFFRRKRFPNLTSVTSTNNNCFKRREHRVFGIDFIRQLNVINELQINIQLYLETEKLKDYKISAWSQIDYLFILKKSKKIVQGKEN